VPLRAPSAELFSLLVWHSSPVVDRWYVASGEPVVCGQDKEKIRDMMK
jgi:hypothetical protein